METLKMPVLPSAPATALWSPEFGERGSHPAPLPLDSCLSPRSRPARSVRQLCPMFSVFPQGHGPKEDAQALRCLQGDSGQVGEASALPTSPCSLLLPDGVDAWLFVAAPRIPGKYGSASKTGIGFPAGPPRTGGRSSG